MAMKIKIEKKEIKQNQIGETAFTQIIKTKVDL